MRELWIRYPRIVCFLAVAPDYRLKYMLVKELAREGEGNREESITERMM